jgi:hypothetical protein
VLRYISGIVILNTNIIDDIKNKCKIEKCEIQPKRLRAHRILHSALYTEKVQWLYERVDGEKK